MSASVFISYARADDEPFAAALYVALGGAGFDVWFDRVSMPNRGLSFYQEIRDAVDAHDRLVAILGPKAAVSAYVRSEWQYALVAGKPVTPLLRVGDYDVLPAELKNLDCPDFRGAWTPVKLAKLVADLQSPPPRLGQLLGVPSPPPHFQPRVDELTAISRNVLPDLKAPLVVALNDRASILHGMGGAGKSVAAAAFARSWESRRAFPDGVLWIDLRESGSRAAPLAEIGARLGGDAGAYTAANAPVRLAECLQDKSVLIVLDNAEFLEQIRPVRDALGHKTRLLITTRLGSLATTIGARDVELGVLSAPTSLAFLADWTGTGIDALPGEATELVRRCGGLAFALALCGAALSHGASWQGILDGLERADLTALKTTFAGYEQFESVAKCMQYSVDLLAEQSGDVSLRYLELVVFAARVRIPEHVIARFWAHRASLTEHRTEAILVELQQRSLAQIETTGAARYVRLHELHRLYLRARTPKAVDLHRGLLQAYRASCPTGWASGPNDGYFFQHASDHFVGADQVSDLVALLTGSPDWMKASARVLHQVQQFSSDVATALAHVDRPLDAIALVTSRCVAFRHVDRYGERCLRAMVRVGRREEASQAARLMEHGDMRWYLVLAVYDEIAQGGDEDAELRDICLGLAQRHRTPEVRAGLMMNVAAVITRRDPERAGVLFRETREIVDGMSSHQQREGPLSELAICLARARRGDEIDPLLADLGASRAGVLARWVEECCRQGRFDKGRLVIARAKTGYELCCALSAFLANSSPGDAENRRLTKRLVTTANKELGLARVQALAIALRALARVNAVEATAALKQALTITRRLKPFPHGDYESALIALIGGLCKTAESQYLDVALSAVQALTRALDIDPAIANYPRRREVANALEEIASALVRANRLEDAIGLIEQDPSVESRGAGIASAIAYTAAVSGHPRGAKLLEMAAERSADIEYREARTDLLCGLAEESLALRRRRPAQALLQMALVSSGGHPFSLTRLVTSLGIGQLASAQRVIRSIDHETTRGAAMAELIWSLVAARRTREARAMIRRLRTSLPNQIVRARMLVGLAEQLAVSGWTEEATRVLRVTDMPHDEGRALLFKSGSALRRKDYDSAIECAMRIDWIWSRSKMLTTIAARLVASNPARALDVVLMNVQSINDAQDVGPDQKTSALSTLARQVAGSGLIDEGLTLASQNPDRALSIATRASILTESADKRPPANEMVDAILADWRQLAAGPGRDDSASAVATLLACVRRWQTAEQITAEIVADNVRRNCLVELARVAASQHDFVAAARLVPDLPLEVWLGHLVWWTFHLEQAEAAEWPQPLVSELQRAAWTAKFWNDVAVTLTSPKGGAPTARTRLAVSTPPRRGRNSRRGATS